MRMVYRPPIHGVNLDVEPQLANWDAAGRPSQVRLGLLPDHIEAVATPLLASIPGRIAVELTIGLSEPTSLISGGRDLDNNLYPVAHRLGPTRGSRLLQPSDPEVHLAPSAAPSGHQLAQPGSVAMDIAPTTGPGRNWGEPVEATTGRPRAHPRRAP